MEYSTKSHYVYVPGGIYGNAYSKYNVKPYGTIWRVPVKTQREYPYASVTGEAVCVLHNVYGPNDPDIPTRIKNNLFDVDGKPVAIGRKGE